MSQKQKEIKPVTAIAEYSATEAALGELKQRLQGAKYEVTTTAGMDTARKDRRELVTLRTSLEAKRKEIKAPALAHCKLIDDEAKRITGELVALEQPIDAQIKAEEDRKAAILAEKKRLEAERVATIQARIDKLKAIPIDAVQQKLDALALEGLIARLEAVQLGAEFAELLEAAKTAKTDVLDSLKLMLTALQEKEAEEKSLQAERENAERVAGIRERIRAIQDWPRGCIGLKADQLRTVFDGFASDPLGDFAELADEAGQARTASLEEINRMIEVAAKAEADAAALAKEKADFEAEQARVREAEVARQKEADLKAQAEREEADRVAAVKRAEEQAVIDAERAELKRQTDELEAARVAEEQRKAAEEAAKTETVTILESEYQELLRDQALLDALRAAGVDNWDGWDVAIESLGDAV